MKRVPSTVISTPSGYAVTRGYTEISGVRLYDDQVVVGDRGQHMISPGTTETVNPANEPGRFAITTRWVR